MAVCLLEGYIQNADGTPAIGVTVWLRVASTEADQAGQFADAGGVTSEPVVTFTGEDGRFSMPAAPGATMLLEISAINLRKYISVPRQPGPIDFRTLV